MGWTSLKLCRGKDSCRKPAVGSNCHRTMTKGAKWSYAGSQNAVLKPKGPYYEVFRLVDVQGKAWLDVTSLIARSLFLSKLLLSFPA